MATKTVKIINAGLNKTGTGTFKTCMRYWGLEHVSYDLDAFNLYRNNDWERLEVLMDRYDSFEDWPWALIYKAFDKRYPEAKFILTVRKNPKIWFRSLRNHAKRIGPLTDFEKFIYGFADPAGHEKEHIDFYLRHNRQVEDYFADRPEKLIVVCWETGDGWKELSDHLGFHIPDIPLPHINKTPNWLDKVERAAKSGIVRVNNRILSTFKS